jgi:hypothetical protein
MVAQQLGKWSELGNQINKQPWVAKWANRGKNATQLQGEAMLREQAALDDRRNVLKVIENEGVDSPMRRHVAQLIKGRLQEEKDRDIQSANDTQQRCTNIRKNLGHMQAVRKEFSEQRRKVQDFIVGPKDTPTFSGLALSGFGKPKAQPEDM